MQRKLGVSTWVWTSRLTDESLAHVAAQAAQLGFDAIELPLVQLGDWDPKRAKDLLGELGLHPVLAAVMLAGHNLIGVPRAEVEATQNYLRGCIDAAASLGATTVAGPLYTATGRLFALDEGQRRAAYAQLRVALAPLVEHAAARDITLAIEPLNRHETSLLNTIDQCFDALEPLLGPGLGMGLDTYHLNIEEQDIAAAVARATEHINHVQLSANDRGIVGADHFDWHGFVHALDLAGYDGPLCVKSFSPHSATLVEAAAIWRPLASSQNALAADSLAYLRNLQAGGLR
ncbi:sugar phosphate isomerase/epimerase family protein [Glutamicibacter arilaitensis]|uniref:sugar phosphate isomerase/epimerase family protein n=1 Tax=Glutamicibacter arilaitensis TaxID=256701 RepID=UPI00384F7D0F